MTRAIILHIDTSNTEQVIIALDVGGVHWKKESTSTKFKSQMTLPLIKQLTAEAGITVSDITAITVAEGPGSFTGLRVGAAIANALGYLLDIPVNGKKALVIPTYEQ